MYRAMVGVHKMKWKNIRIDEINKMGLGYTPCNPYFEEVYAIYDSKAETYEQFKKEFTNATLEN
jgi:hypothetical protein